MFPYPALKIQPKGEKYCDIPFENRVELMLRNCQK